MDEALGPGSLWRGARCRSLVSIPVLMDEALGRGWRSVGCPVSVRVSIPVLMDEALGPPLRARASVEARERLNPCFDG
jgi:hypothetical protein